MSVVCAELRCACCGGAWFNGTKFSPPARRVDFFPWSGDDGLGLRLVRRGFRVARGSQ